MSLIPPLILTLKLEQPAFEQLDQLRLRYFPPARNLLPAHITLFHALPGDEEQAISAALAALATRTAVFEISMPGLRFLGRGVAVNVDAPALDQLRGQLAAEWKAWLSAQDRQRYRPHVTIQNKVASEEARQLYEQLGATWQPFTARAEGLLLWRYLGGPWEHIRTFSFEG